MPVDLAPVDLVPVNLPLPPGQAPAPPLDQALGQAPGQAPGLAPESILPAREYQEEHGEVLKGQPADTPATLAS